MDDIKEFFSRVFDSSNWPARWHCGYWTPFHGWLYIVSNIIIALAYFSIPLILFYLVRKSKNRLPFQGVLWLFILFILACGLTHVFDALMFWYPLYRVSALMLAVTALISSAAVFGLYRIIPTALTFKSPSYLENIIQQRTIELEATNKSLRIINYDLNRAKKLAEQSLKQKDEFIRIAGHELKTPVTSLKMYSELLSVAATEDSIDKSTMIVKMDAQINKLTKLINYLLDTKNFEEGQLTLQPEKFRLDETLREVIDYIQLTTKHRLEFFSDEPVEVYADKFKLEQVISNLLNNAIKFSPGKEKVLIQLTCKDDVAICKITDFGMGIPEAEKKAIFEKYHRVDRNHSNTFPGLGLGLFIAKNIIRQHEGEIWVESEEGKGSSFFFSLPVNVNEPRFQL